MDRGNTPCEDIFIIAGESEVANQSSASTYISRDEYVNRILSGLNSNLIVYVRGMSKSGKTWLVTHLLREANIKYIKISGSQIKTGEAVWEYLAEEEMPDMVWKSTIRRQNMLTKHLKDQHICVVIDDFHYVSDERVLLDLQRGVLKALSDQGVNVILISVTFKKFHENWLSGADMTGRILDVDLRPWAKEELIEIASRGFNQKKGAVHQLYLFAQESYGSPFLMQLLCQLYCKRRLAEHLRSEIEYIESIQPKDLQPILRDAVNVFGTAFNGLYLRLISKDACLDERKYMRHDGKTGNFNQLLFYTLAQVFPDEISPHFHIDIGKLLFRFLTFLHPQDRHIDNKTFWDNVHQLWGHYSTYYSAALEKGIRHDPVLSIEDDMLLVQDPFLCFYLRHSSFVEKHFANF